MDTKTLKARELIKTLRASRNKLETELASANFGLACSQELIKRLEEKLMKRNR